ncbi:hypothetical protein [Allorhizobium undicola]|uniref:hypothetical protein n=1 Tax=Allorhizobium undicola TaxID=78527 RepID=UPI0012B510D6|nr:hypothetical protein [Allorhizobium undicola]
MSSVLGESIKTDDDVIYWAITPFGGVLSGLNRDGLDKILAELKTLEDHLSLKLEDDLELIATNFDERIGLRTLDVILDDDGFLYRVEAMIDGLWHTTVFRNVLAAVEANFELPEPLDRYDK